jgi:DNA-binding CsgD family transcriptional regulator
MGGKRSALGKIVLGNGLERATRSRRDAGSAVLHNVMETPAGSESPPEIATFEVPTTAAGLAGASAMLDMLGEPFALLSAAGFVLHMNAAFAELLGDGLAVRGQRFRAYDPGEDEGLQALVCCAAQSMPANVPSSIVVSRKDAMPFIVRCRPITGALADVLFPARILAAVGVLDIRRRSREAHVLRQAFGLTPSEARLAAFLGEGMSLREIAGQERITFQTALSRLKSVFAKTGTKRQVQLAILFGRADTVLARD